MPLFDEQLIVTVGDTDGLGKSLVELLESRWSFYRKALKRCRKKFSQKSVHALRVEIRRMLATLALLGAVLPADLISPLKDELKDRLKALSRLRDSHVQINTIEDLMEDSPELEPFHAWLRDKERRLAERVKRQLAEVRVTKTARFVSLLTSSLTDAAEELAETGDLQAVLVRATGHAFNDVRVKCRQVTPNNIATIHRTRLAFKKFRYMVEALANLLPGFSESQLKAMQAYQTRMGEIQDVEVLLERAGKFAKKAGLDDLFFEAFCQNLLLHRTQLIGLFLKSANELVAFWPSHTRHLLRAKRKRPTTPRRPTLRQPR